MYSIAIILVIFLALVTYFTFAKRKKSTRKFTAAPGLPLLGNLLDFKSPSDIIPIFQKYSKCGKVVKIVLGPEVKLLISDRAFISFILSSNQVLAKGPEYRPLLPWLGQGLITASGDTLWKSHRKVIGRCFHKNIYSSFVNVFASNAKLLIKQWKNNLENPSFDVSMSIISTSFNIMYEAAMGLSKDTENGTDSTIHKSIKFMCDLPVARSFSAHLYSDLLYRFTSYYRQEQIVVRNLLDHAEKVINTRKDERSRKGNCDVKGTTFLDLLLDENEKGQVFTDAAIRDQVQTFIFAGHDTVASGLQFAIHCLSENQDVQLQIMQEVTRIVQGKETITVEHLQNMNYLEAVIKESLRIYPPVPYYSRSGQDFEYDGYSISKDMSLMLNIYGIHHNEEIFPEPERFIPERFLGKHTISYSFLPFSAGPRNCIGQQFAMLEMKYLLVTLLKNFVILPPSPKHQIQLSGATILTSENGIRVSLQKRKPLL